MLAQHLHDLADVRRPARLDLERDLDLGDAQPRAEAVVLSGEMLRDVGGRFWNSPEWRLCVIDEAGQRICALKFSAEHP